jgi:hypothetical protein
MLVFRLKESEGPTDIAGSFAQRGGAKAWCHMGELGASTYNRHALHGWIRDGTTECTTLRATDPAKMENVEPVGPSVALIKPGGAKAHQQ